jgi:alpha-mannosidase
VDVPATSNRAGRSGDLVPIVLECTLTLDAGAPFLRLSVTGDNTARDHRLRMVFATGVAHGDVHADASFGPVLREAIVVSEQAAAIELPPPTAPLHRYVTLSTDLDGATIISDGLAEYEATDAGDVAITLVRAVDELSRNDLPERPGHAGWPVSTPEAQCLGPFAAAFAIVLHGTRNLATIDAIERAADDVLVPLTGATLRSALAIPAPLRGITLEGNALAFSACKESEDAEWMVVRCVNLSDEPTTGRWRFGFPVNEARWSRLDESVGAPAQIENEAVAFDAPPHAAITLLVR